MNFKNKRLKLPKKRQNFKNFQIKKSDKCKVKSKIKKAKNKN